MPAADRNDSFLNRGAGGDRRVMDADGLTIVAGNTNQKRLAI